jgi:hypothetical protein
MPLHPDVLSATRRLDKFRPWLIHCAGVRFEIRSIRELSSGLNTPQQIASEHDASNGATSRSTGAVRRGSLRVFGDRISR